MSLDDKIAAIMAGNFLADSPLTTRSAKLPIVGSTLVDSARSSPITRPISMPSPPPIISPITSPVVKPKTVSSLSLDPAPTVGSTSSFTETERVKSPQLTSSLAEAKNSHSTLESLLSEFRASKNSQSNNPSPANTGEAQPVPVAPLPPKPQASAPPIQIGIAVVEQPSITSKMESFDIKTDSSTIVPNANTNANVEIIKPQTGKPETLEAEPIKPQVNISETIKPVVAKVEVANPETTTSAEATKLDVTAAVATKHETTEVETIKGGPIKSDVTQSQTLSAPSLVSAVDIPQAVGKTVESQKQIDMAIPSKPVNLVQPMTLSKPVSPIPQDNSPVDITPTADIAHGLDDECQSGSEPESVAPYDEDQNDDSAIDIANEQFIQPSLSEQPVAQTGGEDSVIVKGSLGFDDSIMSSKALPGQSQGVAMVQAVEKKGGGRIAKPPLKSSRSMSPSIRSSTQSATVSSHDPILSPTSKAVTASIPSNMASAKPSTQVVTKPSGKKPPAPVPSTPARYATPTKSSAFYTPSTATKLNQSSVLTAMPVAAARPIKLAIRVRPFSEFEKGQKARRTIAKGNDESELVIVNPKAFDADPDSVANAAKALDNKQWAQSFRFDYRLWDYDPSTEQNHYVSQEEVHETLGLDIVDNVLSGVSCSCFAYGHTSTGKTYSLFGDTISKSRTPNIYNKNGTLIADAGLVLRVFGDIITAVKVDRQIQHGSRVFLSYLEIYNERVIDLLDENPIDRSAQSSKSVDSLKVREHPTYGPYVEGLKKIEVFSAEDAFDLIAKCQRKRASAQTAWNVLSSRSHAIVTLELANSDLSNSGLNVMDSAKKDPLKRALSSAQKLKDELDIPIVKVQMVDLAGSEKDSLREEDDHSFYLDSTPGKVAEVDREKNELRLIRRSLATLGFIIQSLAKGASFRSLPYRDSVLTFLLRDALNGFNHTTMLATISPAHIHYEETLSTLRYAEKLTLMRGKNDGNEESGAAKSEIVEEFRSFHHDVKKGTLAARQMLQHTVADPRQRIARLTAGQQLVLSTPKDKVQELTFTSPLDGKVKRVTELSSEDLEHLQSSFRSLQGQVIEMQIDFDAVKTDRDTLMVELRSARDLLTDADRSRTTAEGKMQSALKALKIAEKELAEHRALLKRKDENIERLLADLTDQKQARNSAEQAYHARTKEFLARFDSLKK
eukprot:scaffold3290_cov165-Ochromonas_danica.AAC.5